MNDVTNIATNLATNAPATFMEDLTLVRIPPFWQSPWFILLFLLSLAVLIFAGRRLYIRLHLKQTEKKAEDLPPVEPPHLTALRRLEELRAKMFELGPYRLTIECSWVLRKYIEALFKLRIVYQTTREFLRHAQTHAALNEEQRASLGQYLQFCDKVKFARRGASQEEMVQLLDYAVAFVKTCSKVAESNLTVSAPAVEKPAVEVPEIAP
jgi:hypothetical protein